MNDPIPVLIPQENVNDEAIEIIAWLVKSSEQVTKGQPLVEIETSKSTVEIASPADGFIHYTHKAGDRVRVGASIGYLTKMPIVVDDAEIKAVEHDSANEVDARHGDKGTVADELASTAAHELAKLPRFSSRAQKLLKQHELDARLFGNSGGLVRSSDVLARLSIGNQNDKRHAASRSTSNVPIQFEPLPRNKRREAEYLRSGSEGTLASVVNVLCPTKGLRAAMTSQTTLAANATVVIVFEVARLLKQFPIFNSTYENGEVGYYQQVNIGIAMDAGQGLKVPVIQNANEKELSEIAEEMQELVFQYLNDELAATSMTGGTFTVTDLSGENIFLFQPLINRGQSAILGVGSEFYMPGSDDGVFSLILGFDHQLSEGRIAAKFLNELRERLSGYEDAFGQSGESATDACCHRCLRSASELQLNDAHLVHSIVPPGYVCSLCLRGF